MTPNLELNWELKKPPERGYPVPKIFTPFFEL